MVTRFARRRAIVVSVSIVSLTFLPLPVDAAGTGELEWSKQFVGAAKWADDYSLTRTFIDLRPSGRAVILYSGGPNEEGDSISGWRVDHVPMARSSGSGSTQRTGW